jgi:hypothetical protein
VSEHRAGCRGSLVERVGPVLDAYVSIVERMPGVGDVAGYDENFVADVARVMEYSDAYELYRKDWQTAAADL